MPDDDPREIISARLRVQDEKTSPVPRLPLPGRQKRVVRPWPGPRAREGAAHVPLRLPGRTDRHVFDTADPPAAAEHDPVRIPADPVQHRCVAGHDPDEPPGSPWGARSADDIVRTSWGTAAGGSSAPARGPACRRYWVVMVSCG